MNLTLLSNIFINKIESFTNTKNWILKISLVSVLLSIFFSCPRLMDLWNDSCGQNESYWKFFYQQRLNPLDFSIFKDLNPESHASKLIFRFSVPLLAKVFFLDRDSVLVIQFVIGFLFFVLFTKINYKFSNNKVFSSLCTFSLALVYTGKLAFTQTGGFFDTFSIFSILLALYYNKNMLTFFLILFSGFNDERGLISIFSILIIFYLIQDKINFKNIFVTISATATYFIIRLILTLNYGLNNTIGHKTGVGFKVFFENKIYFLIETFKFLEGFWIVALIVLIYLIYNKQYQKTIIVFIPFVFSIILSFIVYDIDRSLTYSFLYTIIFFNILCKSSFKSDLNIIALIIFLICILVPTNPIMGAYNKYSNANWFIVEISRLIFKI